MVSFIVDIFRGVTCYNNLQLDETSNNSEQLHGLPHFGAYYEFSLL
jgi:hypothetical protein